MKRITLAKILRSLETMEHEVAVDPAVAGRAPGVRSSACSQVR